MAHENKTLWCLFAEVHNLNRSLTTDDAQAQLVELTKAVILFINFIIIYF